MGGGGRGIMVEKGRLMSITQVVTLIACLLQGVSTSFNLLMDREEVHKLLGLSSEIYLVREGVVNDYALNFVVNVPAHIEQLHFKWQSLIKKPVHYEVVIEFADFFALLQPSSNISNVGRVPQKLESFRISLPCSGRLTTEVPVIIRFTFNVKHTKHNVTLINVKRNKICLLKEAPGEHHSKSKVKPSDSSHPNSVVNGLGGGHQPPVGSINGNSTSSLLFPSPTSPSLLLAGLLGACAVTASVVSVTFFICLRRKLQKLDIDHHRNIHSHHHHNHQQNQKNNNSSSPGESTTNTHSHSNCSDSPYCQQNCGLSTNNSSSPACLLRLPSSTENPNQNPRKWLTSSGLGLSSDLENKFSLPQQPPPPPLSRSPNSYVTISNFWNDILASSPNPGPNEQQHVNKPSNNCSRLPKHNPNNSHLYNNNCNSSFRNTTVGVKGSDVSPYAYAQIIGIQQHQQQPPPPPLIEWYQSSNLLPGGGHIYANHLSSFVPNNNTSTTTSGSLYHNLLLHQEKSPKQVQKIVVQEEEVDGTADCANSQVDGNASTMGRSVGSGSLIQIDGFQCRKNFTKETDVVERFL